MAVLEIRRAGDSVLKEKALPVTKIDKKIKKLLSDMADTMYDAEGVGLAAPQIGISQRVIVVDIGDGLIELINPVIVRASGSEKACEGCLSVPGLIGDVVRFAEVVVEGLNRNGKPVVVEGKGFLARALQHEIDHLDGILFIDKAEAVYKGKESE